MSVVKKIGSLVQVFLKKILKFRSNAITHNNQYLSMFNPVQGGVFEAGQGVESTPIFISPHFACVATCHPRGMWPSHIHIYIWHGV